MDAISNNFEQMVLIDKIKLLQGLYDIKFLTSNVLLVGSALFKYKDIDDIMNIESKFIKNLEFIRSYPAYRGSDKDKLRKIKKKLTGMAGKNFTFYSFLKDVKSDYPKPLYLKSY